MRVTGAPAGVALTRCMSYVVFREAPVVPGVCYFSSTGWYCATAWLWKAARLGRVARGRDFCGQTALWLRRIVAVGPEALPRCTGVAAVHGIALGGVIAFLRGGEMRRADDLLPRVDVAAGK